MAKIKICGLSRPIDIDIVNEALPDYVGFVFAKSKRQVSTILAAELKMRLNPDILAVGVFVNEEIEHIIQLCRTGTIDIVQLHGDETKEYIHKLKASIMNPIIKAVRVRSTEDIISASELSCDYLLLDAYRENQYGGCGETFDWSTITQTGKPYFLAGGIDIGNIMNAIVQTNPYCIDVSSGVETDGWKDSKKIIEIVTKVRNAC